jgi:hypothetical protein
MPSTVGIVASSFLISPLDLPSLVGWWDADDATTFTFSSGTSVSQWNDKSGNNYHLAQGTAGEQPTRSGTVNGRSSVVFDGTDDFLSVASFDMTGSAKVSAVMVFSCAASVAQIILETSANVNQNNGSFTVFRTAQNRAQMARRAGNVLSAYATTATLSTTPSVFVGTADGTLTTNETLAWVNNNGAGTYDANNNTTGDNQTYTLFVGARNGTSFRMNGQIAEIIITKDVLSTNDRELLQSYLKDKWGTP